MNIAQLGRLHREIEDVLPQALVNSDLHTCFVEISTVLRHLLRALEAAQRVYRNCFPPRSFTTNSWDLIYYVAAMWHLPSSLAQRLEVIVIYFGFKCSSLKTYSVEIDRWNEEFTPGDRRQVRSITDELQRFFNQVTRVQNHAQTQHEGAVLT